MKSKICVIGCGWLGFPLAKMLIKLGHEVHGTTTSEEKIAILRDAGIHPFLIRFSAEGVVGDLKNCLLNCITLIVNIPPGLRKAPESEYVQKMMFFIEQIQQSTVKRVLFIGSTSVYDDTKTCPIITETSATSTSQTALQLLKVERLFMTNKNFETTVLRFGGLLAENRHPAKYLSGKTNIKNPEAPVNLIHREDCIAIILKLLKHEIWNETFNAVTTPHPTKKDYYTAACKRMGLPLPDFDLTSINQGKCIDSSKLVQLLNYEFHVKL
ncbi:MAG: hypothetical protein WA775_02765 [Psychroserpens sp.]|uniref:hypothetical protein n=1 Tax=Psychroserpens sp. TaxID=2020870 RepID=UPI003C78690F